MIVFSVNGLIRWCRNRNVLNFFRGLFFYEKVPLMLLTFPITQKWHLKGFYVEQLFNVVPSEKFRRLYTEAQGGPSFRFQTLSIVSRTLKFQLLHDSVTTLHRPPLIYFLSLSIKPRQVLWSHLASGYCLFWFFKPSCTKNDCFKRTTKKMASKCVRLFEQKETKKRLYIRWLKMIARTKARISGAKVYRWVY